jgi:plastocyanin
MKYVLLSLVAGVLIIAAIVMVTLYQSRDYGGQQAGQVNQQGTDASIVVYDGTSFAPATLTIKAGTTVTFDNRSERPMWVASDDHPTHKQYPGFDTTVAQGAPPNPGEDGEFTFERTGMWGYHDHNNPSAVGTIIVN